MKRRILHSYFTRKLPPESLVSSLTFMSAPCLALAVDKFLVKGI